MQFTLQNKTARIVLDTHAAEIHSFQRKDKDFEYMWNGNPEYWAGRNPVLFPQVSSHDSKINIYKGKEYAMGNHGFARNSEFEPVSETDTGSFHRHMRGQYADILQLPLSDR